MDVRDRLPEKGVPVWVFYRGKVVVGMSKV